MMKFLMFICLLFAVMQTSWAQFVGTPYIGYVQKPAPPSSTMGVDFWVSFQNNYDQLEVDTYLALNIASQLPTTVTISFTANNHSYTYNLAANISRRIDLSKMVSDGNTDTTDERAYAYLGPTTGGDTAITGVSQKTMHITSSLPVAVYAFDTYAATTDATVVYPIAAWGTDYYQVSYRPITDSLEAGDISNEIIIANQDNTVITLSDNTTRTLNAGQVFVTNGGGADPTGRHLSATKPVSYFTGATILFIPYDIYAGDVLFEQMVPTKVWDKQYFVPNVQQFASSTATAIDYKNNTINVPNNNNRIRIVSAQNGTVVTYKGASLPATFSTSNTTGNNQISSGGTLNAGQWVELVINDSLGGAYITGTNPIGVAGYLVGGSNGVGIRDSVAGYASSGIGGDPDNAMIPGLNQLIQQVTVSPFMFPLYSATGVALGYTYFDGSAYPDVIHGAIILTKTANKDAVNMVRNGTTTIALDPTKWIDDVNSGMSIYRYQFDNVAGQGASYTISSLVNGGGLLVLCYGLAWYESYYYNAGSGAYSLQ